MDVYQVFTFSGVHTSPGPIVDAIPPARRAHSLKDLDFESLPVAQQTYLFKELYIEIKIRNPKKVGFSATGSAKGSGGSQEARD